MVPRPPIVGSVEIGRRIGPTRIAFSKLDATGQAAYVADLETLWSEHNKAGNGRTLIGAEYLEVTATRG